MREPTVHAVLVALKAHGSRAIAAAIYADNDIGFIEKLIDALAVATTELAAYPHDVVIAEADALLYDTLRYPIADALPTGLTDIDPTDVARHHRISAADAAAMLNRLRLTDADAARHLLDTGVESWWTLEQQQVATCIRELLDTDIIPTRARVVAHATMHARDAMRPRDGAEPFVYSPDPSLRPRILSPSPMAVVPGWMARMDADPPAFDIAEDRIAYLSAAMSAMGRASVAAGRVRQLPPRQSPPPARMSRPSLTLA